MLILNYFLAGWGVRICELETGYRLQVTGYRLQALSKQDNAFRTLIHGYTVTAHQVTPFCLSATYSYLFHSYIAAEKPSQ